LILSSLLILGPIFYMVKKISTNPLLSIFIYFTIYLYLQSFNIIRQLIAVSIIFLGLFFLVKKEKPWIYILFVLGAATFHISALLSLILVIINKLPQNKNFYIILIGCAMIVGLFFINPLSNKLAFLLGYSNYLLSHDS